MYIRKPTQQQTWPPPRSGHVWMTYFILTPIQNYMCPIVSRLTCWRQISHAWLICNKINGVAEEANLKDTCWFNHLWSPRASLLCVFRMTTLHSNFTPMAQRPKKLGPGRFQKQSLSHYSMWISQSNPTFISHAALRYNAVQTQSKKTSWSSLFYNTLLT